LREGVHERAPRTLVLLGLTLVLLAQLFDTFADHGGPYHPVTFVLEETFELLGAIAFLMAVLSKGWFLQHRNLDQGRIDRLGDAGANTREDSTSVQLEGPGRRDHRG